MTARSPNSGVSRRTFLSAAGLLGAATVLPACSTSRQSYFAGSEGGPELSLAPSAPAPAPMEPPLTPYEIMYGPVVDEGFEVPAIPIEKIEEQFLRQIVADPTGEAPGTIVVDTASHHLYFTRPGGQAIRYGVGLGRAGFEWSGRAVIQWKQKWPKWTPPEEMIARDPSLAKWGVDNGGMPGGLTNPLGARALYIFQNGEDTLYRLHGSPEWSSIGKSVSSGCVRLMHQDIIDLYERVPNGTPVAVVSGLGMLS